MLALAAASLVYGSLLAFRAADFRGVVAYSSLAQSGLIVLGLFAGTDLGFDGAVLQMVAHGLISASLFLLAGVVERRTTTGEFRLLGGMARGRPALATLLMTVGVISLAVPGSSMFAGEFLILAGVFQRAWWWSVIGAAAIVLAAMYMLRLISAVLHEARGSTVSDEALDLRPGELALIVPLVGVLLALSVWPAGISHHSFAPDSPDRRGAERVQVSLNTPPIDWFALSPILTLTGAAFVALLGAVLVPRTARRTVAAGFSFAGFLGGLVARDLALRRQRGTAHTIVGGRLLPRPLDRARADHPLRRRARDDAARLRAHARWGRNADLERRDDHVAEFFALLLASAAGMAFFVGAANLITLFLALEWFSIALYVMCAIDYDLEGSLEAGLKYLIVGSFGAATLLFGSALVYGATGQVSFQRHRRTRSRRRA